MALRPTKFENKMLAPGENKRLDAEPAAEDLAPAPDDEDTDEDEPSASAPEPAVVYVDVQPPPVEDTEKPVPPPVPIVVRRVLPRKPPFPFSGCVGPCSDPESGYSCTRVDVRHYVTVAGADLVPEERVCMDGLTAERLVGAGLATAAVPPVFDPAAIPPPAPAAGE